MADDKKTQIGATGPARAAGQTGAQPVMGPQTGALPVAAPLQTPVPIAPSSTPVPMAPSSTPVPMATNQTLVTPGSTSYLPPVADPLIGQTLAGRYVISKKLGEGGMGAVYLATHNLLDKQVALKILHNEFARKPDLVERFMQEAKSASRIRHENVIDISDFGMSNEGLVFFAMELLKGHDLHEEIARARLAGQLLPWTRSKKIFLQICAALTAAHGHGIVHRDLKPENIYLIDFLGEGDFVKLLDFGIAKLTEVSENDRKLTRTGMLFGTPEYMSPEQARGEPVDHRVDIYAMGCILFQLITGRVPFEADNFMGVLSLHLTEPPPAIPVDVFDRIGAPRELAAIIDRALLKDRDQRWATIADLANAVRTASGDAPMTAQITAPRAESVTAPATTTTARPRTQWTGNLAVPQVEEGVRPKKSKLPLMLGATVVVLGGGIAAFVATRGGHEPAGGGGVASGSGPAGGSLVTMVPGDAMEMTVRPDAAAPPPNLVPPEWSMIRLDSVPRGADVVELLDNGKEAALGKTLLPFKLKGSTQSRRFSIRLKGYSSVVVEITPNNEKITDTETLEKGAATTTVVHKVDGTGRGSGTIAPLPGPGSGSGSSGLITHPIDPPPEIHPDAAVELVAKPDAAVKVEPPHLGSGSAKGSDDCRDDEPCLKPMPGHP